MSLEAISPELSQHWSTEAGVHFILTKKMTLHYQCFGKL